MTTADAAVRPAPPLRLDWRLIAPALAGVVAYAFVLLDPKLFVDGDCYWHITAGQWMLDHGHVLKTDIFSWSMPGAPWDSHEWLSEVLMALAYRAGGWSGVAVLAATAAGALAMILAARLGRSLAGPALVIVLLVAFSCIAPSLLARPHLLTLPILAAWTIGLMQAQADRRAPSLLLLPLMTLWANLHGGYFFGLALIGPFALEALLGAPGRRREVVVGWGVFGVLAVLAALITPFGIQGLLFPIKLLRMTSLSHINEWRPADFSSFEPMELALLLAVFIFVSRGVRMPIVRLLLLLLLLHMALQHSRHRMLLAIVGALIVADPLGVALGQPAAGPAGRRAWIAALTAAGVAVVLGGLRVAFPIVRTDAITTPATAFAHVPAALKRQPVFNDYNFGGYLIFQGVRPFIDGRADMYGDAFVNSYFDATREGNPDTLDRLIGKYHPAWAIFSPDNPAVRLLDRTPGWRRIYADKYAVVQVGDPAPASAPVAAR
ncbi:MAG: hypothetical protein WDM92_09465 [Caulobacteraceae bacterium]